MTEQREFGKELDKELELFDKDKCDKAIKYFCTSAYELNLNLIEARHVFKSLFSATNGQLKEKLGDMFDKLDPAGEYEYSLTELPETELAKDVEGEKPTEPKAKEKKQAKGSKAKSKA